MLSEIQASRFPKTWTAVIRDRVHPSEFSRFVPAACGEVWSFLRAAKIPNPGRHLAVYLDGEGSIEVGAEVAAPFTGNDRVHCSELPGALVAHVAHFGPYQQLGIAHSALRQWCEAHGRERTGVCWEVYGHWQESWNREPSKIRTDIYHRLDG